MLEGLLCPENPKELTSAIIFRFQGNSLETDYAYALRQVELNILN
jgi:hypothetical protein